MDIKNWAVCLVEPNKFEAKIIIDLLRAAGVTKLAHFLDSDEAMAVLELQRVNVIIASVDSTPTDGVTWTRLFRRNHALACRKAAIFLTSGAFSRVLAEQCRHAGANALIGKPVSAKALIATINKVLANPREFIDAENYVGPCRRAGIVTAGPVKKRRKADGGGPPPQGFTKEAEALRAAADQLVRDPGKKDLCVGALGALAAAAQSSGDGPLMRACAALTAQLTGPDLGAPTVKAAISACAADILLLAKTPPSDREAREAIAEHARQAAALAAA